MDADHIGVRTAANRHLLADFFDSLTPSQLQTRSLCSEWTVREVLGHLTMPLSVGLGRLLLDTVRHNGSVDRASVAIGRRLALRERHELTAVLRAKAELTTWAPGVGHMGQMVDGCVHLRDCTRPLGLDTDVPIDDWRLVLDWLPTRPATLGHRPKGRLSGLRLVATDQQWTSGQGAEVVGPSEALALGVCGRMAALTDLRGPGVKVLTQRIATGT